MPIYKGFFTEKIDTKHSGFKHFFTYLIRIVLHSYISFSEAESKPTVPHPHYPKVYFYFTF